MLCGTTQSGLGCCAPGWQVLQTVTARVDKYVDTTLTLSNTTGLLTYITGKPGMLANSVVRGAGGAPWRL